MSVSVDNVDMKVSINNDTLSGKEGATLAEMVLDKALILVRILGLDLVLAQVKARAWAMALDLVLAQG